MVVARCWGKDTKLLFSTVVTIIYHLSSIISRKYDDVWIVTATPPNRAAINPLCARACGWSRLPPLCTMVIFGVTGDLTTAN